MSFLFIAISSLTADPIDSYIPEDSKKENINSGSDSKDKSNIGKLDTMNDSTTYDSVIVGKKDTILEDTSMNSIKVKSAETVSDIVWLHVVSQSKSSADYELGIYINFLDIIGYILCNIFLVTVLINLLARRQNQWNEGRIYYNHYLYGLFKRNKVVAILGNHDSFAEITKQIINRVDAPKYVIIVVKDDVERNRIVLGSTLTDEELKKVVMCQGNITSLLDLQRLHLEKANEVIIIGDVISQEKRFSTHDSDCIKCIQLLRKIVVDNFRKTQKLLECRVFFEYRTAFSTFQMIDHKHEEYWSKENRKGNLVNVPPFVIKPMHFYEQSCEKVLALQNPSQYLPLEGNEQIGIDSEKHVHLIIVGQTKMGVSLALEAAHLAHYPNFFKKDAQGHRVGPRTRITFIDERADLEMDYLTGSLKSLFDVSPKCYRDLTGDFSVPGDFVNPLDSPNSKYYGDYLGKDFIDVEWEFIKGNISSHNVTDYLASVCSDKNSITTIAICFSNQNQSIAAAMYLPIEIYNNVLQVLVYQRNNVSVLEEIATSQQFAIYSKLKPFGSITSYYDDSYSHIVEKDIDDDLKKSKPQKDNKGKAQITQWWSNRYRYNMWWTKMRCIGYNNNDPISKIDDNNDLLCAIEHNRWNMEQLILGYRPLTEIEQKQVYDYLYGESAIHDPDEISLKNVYKFERRAHYNICSNERLKEIDKDVLKYDVPQMDIQYKELLTRKSETKS